MGSQIGSHSHYPKPRELPSLPSTGSSRGFPGSDQAEHSGQGRPPSPHPIRPSCLQSSCHMAWHCHMCPAVDPRGHPGVSRAPLPTGHSSTLSSAEHPGGTVPALPSPGLAFALQPLTGHPECATCPAPLPSWEEIRPWGQMAQRQPPCCPAATFPGRPDLPANLTWRGRSVPFSGCYGSHPVPSNSWVYNPLSASGSESRGPAQKVTERW